MQRRWVFGLKESFVWEEEEEEEAGLEGRDFLLV